MSLHPAGIEDVAVAERAAKAHGKAKDRRRSAQAEARNSGVETQDASRGWEVDILRYLTH